MKNKNNKEIIMTTLIKSPQRGVLGKAQTYINQYQATVYTRDALKAGVSKMAFQQMPTALLTLTVKEPKLRSRNDDGRWLVPDATLIRKAGYLLHFVNSAVFGHQYQKHGKGLSGFGCIEKQANHQPHLHLAMTDFMPPKQFLKIKKIITTKIKKFSLFNEAGTDFRLIGGDDSDYWQLGNYLGKDGRLVLFGTDGVY
jgi:hypothetical protein